jgi:HSP20 family protein
MNTQLQNAPGREPGARPAAERDQPFTVPPVDVFEDDHGITLLADLPGVSRDRLNVRVDGDTLWFEATALTAVPEGLELIYGEAEYPTYRRQFTLSRELDGNRIEANLKDGVLKLTVPKNEEAKPGRIEVRVG